MCNQPSRGFVSAHIDEPLWSRGYRSSGRGQTWPHAAKRLMTRPDHIRRYGGTVSARRVLRTDSLAEAGRFHADQAVRPGCGLACGRTRPWRRTCLDFAAAGRDVPCIRCLAGSPAGAGFGLHSALPCGRTGRAQKAGLIPGGPVRPNVGDAHADTFTPHIDRPCHGNPGPPGYLTQEQAIRQTTPRC